MKRFALSAIVGLVAFSVPAAFAAPSMEDYTYVDCHNGQDSTAVPFDHTKPYSTLKAAIEGSINHINANWNIPANAQAVLSKRFVIKAKALCVFDGYGANGIRLNFWNGNVYHNDLFITSDDTAKPFWIRGYYFYDSQIDGYANPRWITFDSTYFMGSSAAAGNSYFRINSNGIGISNSVITMGSSPMFQQQTWKYPYCNVSWCAYAPNPANAKISNSLIRITGNQNADTNFLMPGSIENSKIEFTVPNGANGKLILNADGSNFLNLIKSTRFDLGGKNVHVNVDVVNSQFTNFGTFTAAGGWNVFTNNTVLQMPGLLTVNNWYYAYNNVFAPYGIADSSDPNNERRNLQTPAQTGGVGWRYRKALGTYLEQNFTDATLRNEAAPGSASGETFTPTYPIFQ